MKKYLFCVSVAWLVCTIAVRAADDAKSFPKQLLKFSADKEAQARQLATNLNLTVSSDIWNYFACARTGDWPGMTNAYAALRARAGQYEHSSNDPEVRTPVWQTIIEVQTAYEAFAMGDKKYPLAFGEGIIGSIPAGSIYFGGTDPGRGLVTALVKSHADGKPFFVLTQNPLVDLNYVNYLQAMYAKQIHLPGTNDLQKAFTDYMEDVRRRLKHDEENPDEPRQVKPGEEVKKVEGQVQVSGVAAVMAINGLLVRHIFDHNPDREFFLEESYAIDWMYPYLMPHGLIFKLNRQPLAALPAKVVDEDHVFWTTQCDAVLGKWLKPDTTVSNVCAFVEAVYLKKDWSHFSGDRTALTNEFVSKTYSKLRSSIAGMYVWRADDKSNPGDRKRMRTEADYAFRQALALCPSNPESVYRYVNLLTNQHRFDDAILVARTAQRVAPEDNNFKSLMRQLKDQQQTVTGTERENRNPH